MRFVAAGESSGWPHWGSNVVFSLAAGIDSNSHATTLLRDVRVQMVFGYCLYSLQCMLWGMGYVQACVQRLDIRLFCAQISAAQHQNCGQDSNQLSSGA